MQLSWEQYCLKHLGVEVSIFQERETEDLSFSTPEIKGYYSV